MEKRNVLLFAIISLGIMVGWNYLFPQPQSQATTQTATTGQSPSAPPKVDELLKKGTQTSFETDVFKGVIDGNGGDIRDLLLQKYNATEDEKQDMDLLYNGKTNDKSSVYIARTGLIDNSDSEYLFKDIPFVTEKSDYKMSGDTLEVRLTATQNGIVVNKIYTFTKGSYVINLHYDVQNNAAKALSLGAVYSLIRDDKTPEGESRFVHTYTGPVVYTPEGKFQKISFGDLDSAAKNNRDSADYIRTSREGWVGIIQHYFITTWLMNPKNQNGSSSCGTSGTSKCQIEVRKRATDGLYSVGLRVDQPILQPGTKQNFGMSLYAGPAEYKTISAVADKLELSKDYGKVHIFSSPLFWLLNFFHSFTLNWGWAIIILTVAVKILLLPLTAASYRSMAKMRNVAPHLKLLKEQCGDDKAKMQQEMMALYKREKINPLGGCLPIFLQIPIFIGLYWALLSSVELRQAPWMGWIHDLARPDPFFILPVIMAVTMIAQTYLNPPPPDPMQAKMMKIMPFAFSAMFFFFPAGLVLYYVVNNALSILQQWLINKKISNADPYPPHHKGKKA